MDPEFKFALCEEYPGSRIFHLAWMVPRTGRIRVATQAVSDKIIRARGGAMESENILPGKPSTVPCLHCGGTVHFILSGGPQHLRCSGCGATVDLDVVQGGARWTWRRVLRTSDSRPSGPT